MQSEQTPISGVTLLRGRDMCALRFSRPLRTVSTGPVGAGHSAVNALLNVAVTSDLDSARPELSTDRIADLAGIAKPYAGFITSVDLRNAITRFETDGTRSVLGVGTVGVLNAARPGESSYEDQQPAGTINLLIAVDADLAPGAHNEAIAIATEAKVLSLIEAGVKTPDGGVATGTSTDATGIACTGRGSREQYAGLVAPVGYLIGRVVREIVGEGLRLLDVDVTPKPG